jgi:hypothetical protein
VGNCSATMHRAISNHIAAKRGLASVSTKIRASVESLLFFVNYTKQASHGTQALKRRIH